MNKLEHARKAHDIILGDREAANSKVPLEVNKIHVQNQMLA